MVNHPNRRRKASTATAAAPLHDHEHDYSALLGGVRAAFERTGGAKLFLTHVEGLNDLYLNSLPGERQVHNCCACRRFIERYGSLVTISEGGETMPAMWS